MVRSLMVHLKLLHKNRTSVNRPPDLCPLCKCRFDAPIDTGPELSDSTGAWEKEILRGYIWNSSSLHNMIIIWGLLKTLCISINTFYWGSLLKGKEQTDEDNVQHVYFTCITGTYVITMDYICSLDECGFTYMWLDQMSKWHYELTHHVRYIYMNLNLTSTLRSIYFSKLKLLPRCL